MNIIFLIFLFIIILWIQNFINFYPYSEKLEEANDLVQELRIKLEYKAFEIAKQSLLFIPTSSAVTTSD